MSNANAIKPHVFQSLCMYACVCTAYAHPCLRTTKYMYIVYCAYVHIQTITVIARSKNDDFTSVDANQTYAHAHTSNYKSYFTIDVSLIFASFRFDCHYLCMYACVRAVSCAYEYVYSHFEFGTVRFVSLRFWLFDLKSLYDRIINVNIKY